MKKLAIDVSGMHCKSCEILLEHSIQKVKNVEKVRANQGRGVLEISYTETPPDEKTIQTIIEEHGYIMEKEQKLPWFHTDLNKYREPTLIILVLIALYMIAKINGFSFGISGDFSSPSFIVAFFIGLTAGVSSCMALVGGLILSVSAKWNEEHIHTSKWRRFEPHLYFNIGRIAGFGILGGLLGIFGSFISLSSFVIGLLTVGTGFIMFLLGINLSELSPRLSRVSVTLPRFLNADISKKDGISKHIIAISSGVLTFFLPCGFTLAMQAYAVTTGSFTIGALTMMAFAVGTAPGLFGIGALTSYLSGTIAKRFFRFTGILVLLLALFNISNGYTLMSLGNTAKEILSTGVISDEVQEIQMTESDGGYTPNIFHIKPNMKTRWIIHAINPYTCASQLVAPAIRVQKQLNQGENSIEFISPTSGNIRFSCSMGMYTGEIIIDNDRSDPALSSPSSQTIKTPDVVTNSGYSCSTGTRVKK